MALNAGSGALALRPGPTAAGAGASPLARRLLLPAGVAAAAFLGVLAPQLGALTMVTALAGGAALLAAFASSYAALAMLIVLLLVPIGAAGELPLPINEIDAIYGAALAGLALRTVMSGERVALGPLGLALLAFLAAGVLALAPGVLGPGETTTALSHFRGLFGYALIPVLVLSLGEHGAARRRTLVYLLCAVGVLTAARGVLSWAELNGLVQLGGVLHRLASPDNREFVGAVPALSGDFGYLRAWAGNFEGNTLGAFVLMVLPLAAYLALAKGNALARLAFAGGALLLAVALVVSYSRGAYLGLAAATLPALLALWRRHPLGALALALAGIALFVFLVNQLPGAEDRLATVRLLRQDPTVQHRQLVYEEVLDSVARNPVWGVGLGTSVGVIGTGADSLYLFLVLRGGLLVTAAFLALAWIGGRRLLAAWRSGRLKGLDVAVAVSFLAFAAHSTVDYALWNPKVALTAWLLVGVLMAAALERRPLPSTDANDDRDPAELEARWPRW